jgi:hypothetical protein
MTLQVNLGLGKTPQFLGQTMTAASFTNNLSFNYPPGQPGDTIFAYVVSENLIVPTPPSGWNTLYSNTVTASNGTGSARLLMFKRRGYESSSNITVSGGGNCTCAAFRGFHNRIQNVTEFVANNSVGNTDFTQTINSQQALVILVNQDGGTGDANITITNTTASFSNTPGYFRSMAVGYNLKSADNPISVNTSSDSVYGVYLTIL